MTHMSARRHVLFNAEDVKEDEKCRRRTCPSSYYVPLHGKQLLRKEIRRPSVEEGARRLESFSNDLMIFSDDLMI